ncbi:MAG: 3'(2'),5'-bisphosphate nucleotidase CysQ [Rhizobiaceae bacterium]
MPGNNFIQADQDLLVELAKEAGQIAMKWFGKNPEVWMKEGDSPVSEADFAVDSFLKEKLLQARPDYGWLSEETDDDKSRLNTKRTFVVDPIDGTRGFIGGMDQWCVSIAIVENNRPTVGVLECPALNQTIVAGVGQGATANGRAISSSPFRDDEPIRVTGPKSFQTASLLASKQPVEKTKFVPSLAYRIAMVAMGEMDLTLARASAKDWDLAAADLIAVEAGSILTDIDGNGLIYNCSDVRQGALVACHASHHNEMLDLARRAMNKQPE